MTELLKPARRELETASRSLDDLGAGTTARDRRRAWCEFLVAIEKVWTKALSASRSKRSAVEPVISKFGGHRKADPLLQYLKQSRHSDQHNAEDVATHRRGDFVIHIPAGRVHVDKIEFVDDDVPRIEGLRSEGPGGITTSMTAGSSRLEAVTNKGIRFCPPATHLGAAVNGTDPVEVGRIAVSFYSLFLDEMERALLVARAKRR